MSYLPRVKGGRNALKTTNTVFTDSEHQHTVVVLSTGAMDAEIIAFLYPFIQTSNKPPRQQKPISLKRWTICIFTFHTFTFCLPDHNWHSLPTGEN